MLCLELYNLDVCAIANIQDILASQLDVQAHISNAIKLGKKGGPKPRLLKIAVESEEKATILRNVKKAQNILYP